MSLTTRDNAAGFTLLELLAALLITSIGLWLALPMLAGSRKERALDAATSALVAKIEQTRNRAMATGNPTSIVIDTQSGTYRSDGSPSIALPKGVAFETPGSPSLVVFRPDGTATQATFALRHGRAEARIGIDWLTGRAAVTFER